MSNPWSRNSPLSNLIWTIKHNRYGNKLSRLDQQIATHSDRKDGQRSYEKTGPDYTFTDWDSLYEYIVEMWATSSQLINAAAQAKGARYFHFLQPNQYVEGSKPIMSDEERAVAFVEQGYGTVYRVAHPFIQKKTAWFAENGIAYHDLTYLYKEVENPVYIDNCCHFNHLGSAMIVNKVVDTIHQANLAEASAK